MSKIKILAWGDYCVPTGFATVMSNILKRLDPEEFEIDVLGINYTGDPDYDHVRYPGKIWPARTFSNGPYNDLYGRQKVLDLLREENYDTLFILQDTFIAATIIPKIIELRTKFHKKFKIVYYFPVDSPPWKKWITGSVSIVDIPVAYTRYGYECCVAADPELGHNLQIIPHGVDLIDFFPFYHEMPSAMDYRHFHYPASKGKLLLGNINRNQPRKDIVRSLLVLSELKRRKIDVCMYLHMTLHDIGGDFTPIALHLGLQREVDYFLPRDLDANGYPAQKLNLIYNMLDAVVTTSLGEGWGLSLTEAMATRTLVIAPNHTSISEILADGRGILVNCGNSSGLWTIIDSDNMTLRPLTDVDDMANKIEHFPANKKWRNNIIIDDAYQWVRNLNWDLLVQHQWKNLLTP